MNERFLSKEILKLYSYVELRNMILRIFKLFNYLEDTEGRKAIPRFTSDYRVRYAQYVRNTSSKVEKCVIDNLMSEIRDENTKIQLNSKITDALRRLGKTEAQVFDLIFYNNKSEEDILSVISYGRDKFYEIRKSACVKFLAVLKLDIHCFN